MPIDLYVNFFMTGYGYADSLNLRSYIHGYLSSEITSIDFFKSFIDRGIFTKKDDHGWCFLAGLKDRDNMTMEEKKQLWLNLRAALGRPIRIKLIDFKTSLQNVKHLFPKLNREIVAS